MLAADGLCKSFAGRPALQDVSFHVGKGEIFGLLGHNGAGKSTSLGIILGMVAADRGDVTIDGISVVRDRAKALRKVGAIFEAPSFYDYLSGWQNLKLLVNYTCRFDPRMAEDVVKRVGLGDRIHSKVRTYSHGMRQRLALAQALLPEPEVLLLDEPTDGLDPEGIRWFRDFILTLREERGTTVLFNSHLLSEVELMCDRVAILSQGKRVFQGAISELQEGPPVYEADLEPWGTACGLILGAGGEVLGTGRLGLPHSVDPADFVRNLVGAGVRVRAFAPVKRSLEDLYMELLEGKSRKS